MSGRLRHIFLKILLPLFFSSQVAHVWHHINEDVTFHQASTDDDSLISDFYEDCELCELVMEDASFKPEAFEPVQILIQEELSFPESHNYYFNACSKQSGRDPPASLFHFIS